MLRWAALQELAIVNTFFDRAAQDLWTFKTGDRKRQNDFICIDQASFELVTKAGVTEDISIGIDHRAVAAELNLCTRVQKPIKKTMKKRRCVKGWKPKSQDEYATAVDERLALMKDEIGWLETTLGERCNEFERILLETAHRYDAHPDLTPSTSAELSSKARSLIVRRK